MTKPASSLLISGLELSVHLGWPEEERLQKQTVLLDVDIWFPEPPKACVSDRLDDTVCYANLINEIHKKTKARKFRLIEHLASEVYKTIKSLLPEKTRVIVRVNKTPDVQGLKGSVRFSYWDDI